MARRTRRATGSATPATTALQRAGVAFSVHTYEHEPTAGSYGLEAAAALRLAPATVFKTLLAETDAGPVIGIVPVSGRLDLKALASEVGAKRATLAAPDIAERITGYVVGGISPLGQRTRLRTVLDATAADHRVIYISGGRRGLDLGIAPDDLLALTDATYADIARSVG